MPLCDFDVCKIEMEIVEKNMTRKAKRVEAETKKRKSTSTTKEIASGMRRMTMYLMEHLLTHLCLLVMPNSKKGIFLPTLNSPSFVQYTDSSPQRPPNSQIKPSSHAPRLKSVQVDWSMVFALQTLMNNGLNRKRSTTSAQRRYWSRDGKCSGTVTAP